MSSLKLPFYIGLLELLDGHKTFTVCRFAFEFVVILM